METGGRVILKRGRAKPLWRGHPWVYRDSIESIEGGPGAGDLVTIADDQGREIGSGYLSPESRIAVRIIARGLAPAEVEAPEFLRERLQQAIRLREETLDLPVTTDGYRVVHSEGDSLPGLIVDRFGPCLSVQFSTVGMHRRRDRILDLLQELMAPGAIFEQPDQRMCRIEGIQTQAGLVRGTDPGEPPSIIENGVTFRIGIGIGQKTGFYADQRDNRNLLGRLVRGRSVLDLYTYTGGFGLYAALNGASEVLAIDSSGPALALAVENAMLNHGRQVRFQRGDAKDALNDFHREKRGFDIVVCDPPRFARDRAGVKKALTAYRDLHLRALRVVRPGGMLAASSCSGSVSETEFEETIRDAAYDVGRSVQILHRGGQAPDHPVHATCPEGRYLKFVLACVT